MTRMRRSVVGAGFVALGALCGARDASAAGFASARFGGEQGNVVTTNPTALYFNPAGIAFSDGIHLYLDGELALRHATWDHTAPQPGANDQPNAQVGNGGQAHLFNVFGGPALAATMKIGNNFALGAGLFVPFGGRVNWGQNSDFANVPGGATASCAGKPPACPLAVDGPQRWHIINAALTFIYATVGAAYRLGPLSIGASGNFVNSSATETQAHTLTGNIDSTAENRASLDVSGNNGSFGVGAMLEAVPQRLWIGVSYQAQPGLGPHTMSGTLNYANGPAPYYAQTGNNPYKVDFHETLPDIIRGGARLRVNDAVELRLFGDYTRWSVMQAQCISKQDTPCAVYGPGGDALHPYGADATPRPQTTMAYVPRNWRDTWGARAGASYWLKPEIELFGGLGYEIGAAPDSTMEPGAMDGDNIGIALGGRFALGHLLFLAASYTHLQFLNRDVTTSELATRGGQPVSIPTLQQDGNGQYTQWIGIFDANMEKQF
jgi:long-chain fatty acid transport protein